MENLDITKIPSIMRANDWPNGAALMEKWFNDPANDNPQNGIHSVNLVTMDWVLSYPRARSVYDKLVNEKIWTNDAAQKEIIKLLKRKNLVGNTPQRFQMPRMILAMEQEAIQFRVVGGNADMLVGSLDDLRASLGNFTFRVVVGGTVAPIMVDKKVNSGIPVKVNSGSYLVKIDEVGVYVKDSYDFNDSADNDQSLGNWNQKNNSVGRTILNGGNEVHNSDFRKWRIKTGKGGDFLIYSNIFILRQTTQNSFTFKSQ